MSPILYGHPIPQQSVSTSKDSWIIFSQELKLSLDCLLICPDVGVPGLLRCSYELQGQDPRLQELDGSICGKQSENFFIVGTGIHFIRFLFKHKCQGISDQQAPKEVSLVTPGQLGAVVYFPR